VPATRVDGAWRRSDAVALGLVALVVAIYGEVGGFGFVNLDDGRYVYTNPHVRAGVTPEGFRWAWTTFTGSNWHPVTWLSHMLDVELFGVKPRWHHAVNVGLHAADAVLLFFVLQAATAARWRSATVAALFAAHPLHVESVAWVAERKDVLSTGFGLLAMLAYVAWVRRGGAVRYLALGVCFALSLLSKPMLVTLPVLLLLLDGWPLGRLSAASIVARVTEKLPLFVIGAASSAVTYVAQAHGGAVSSTESLPLLARLENTLLSYAQYLAMTVWPSHLAVGYPHPAWTAGGIGVVQVATAALVLGAITAVVAGQRRRRPYLAVGWLWYGVTLLPVIGIVQVGLQGRADRYTYVPLIGIFVALAWTIGDLAAPSRRARVAVAAATIALIAVAGALARRQASYWRDSVTLFGHAVEVVPDDALAWRNLGVAYHDLGQDRPAAAALKRSVDLMPYDVHAWMDLAVAYTALGQRADAAECFAKALAMNPDDPSLLYDVAIASASQGQWARVREVHARLQRIRPELADQLAARLKGAPLSP